MDLPSPSTGEWPAVPPAPIPVRPTATPLGPEPPIINTDANLIVGTATEPPTGVVASVPVTAVPAAGASSVTGPVTGSGSLVGHPVAPPVSPLPPVPRGPRATPRPLPPPPVPVTAPVAASSEATGAFSPLGAELIWQPRFAITVAAVILVAFTIVTLPLWIVLYRLVGTQGAQTNDIMALCMMLLGGFVAATAAWAFIVEMRAKVRMVDTMARRGEAAAPMVLPPMSGSPTSIAARVEAQHASAAAALDASGRLLGSFSGVLKSFGQLWAQVAMLAVALALFTGATILSLP